MFPGSGVGQVAMHQNWLDEMLQDDDEMRQKKSACHIYELTMRWAVAHPIPFDHVGHMDTMTG